MRMGIYSSATPRSLRGTDNRTEETGGTQTKEGFVKRIPTLMASMLAACLAAQPSEAGDFVSQFEDLEDVGNHIISGGPGRDGIPAMNNPDFVDPDQVSYVAPDDLVLGVYMNGIAKAYPENLGWWHEIVNDVIGGQGISVTFCPLTGTGLVFDATNPDGSQFELGVSGLLVNSNLIMFDRRDQTTLYPQMAYTASSARGRTRSSSCSRLSRPLGKCGSRCTPIPRLLRRARGWIATPNPRPLVTPSTAI
jgi:hypothetical protein